MKSGTNSAIIGLSAAQIIRRALNNPLRCMLPYSLLLSNAPIATFCFVSLKREEATRAGPAHAQRHKTAYTRVKPRHHDSEMRLPKWPSAVATFARLHISLIRRPLMLGVGSRAVTDRAGTDWLSPSNFESADQPVPTSLCQRPGRTTLSMVVGVATLGILISIGSAAAPSFSGKAS